VFRIKASQANGAKSRGPITEEGKRASAANSALSTGPRTPEGKARSSRNGLDHGLLSQSITLPEEENEAFRDHLRFMAELFEPVGYRENYLIQVAAVCEWRRMRVWCLEHANIAFATRRREMTADEFTIEMNNEIPATHTALAVGDLSDNSHRLQFFRLCELGFSREARRALAEFHELAEKRINKERRQQREKAKKEKRSEPNPGEILS
jgi:hypothetical protein